MELDVENSDNTSKLKNYCGTCFPLMTKTNSEKAKCVDLLSFSNYNGLPHPVIDTARKPRRFLADFRYSWSVPLSHCYPSVEKEVLSSCRVKSAIARMAKIEPSVPNGMQNRAVQFLWEIRANFSKFICKCCAYVLYKLFRRLMDKLIICPDEIKELQIAESTGTPLVYLPLHRSHLDYLLITWCNWHFGLKLPHIASGDNLNLSGLGWLLRATGAFFIRRRLNPDDNRGKDHLYRSVLHSYIENILAKNMPIEFFLEGTRNRFGKALTPKNGLISNVVEAVQQGFIQDCFLVPVSYTYDAVIEGVFLQELMGVPKTRESVINVLRGILNGFNVPKQCGCVRVHYGRPIRLTEYLSAMTKPFEKTFSRPIQMTKLPTSFSYRELVPWHRNHSETLDDRALIRAIGFHVVYEAELMSSVSLVAVVSCIFLAKWRTRVSRRIFEEDCTWLCDLIVSGGGDVMGYRQKETTGHEIACYAFEKLRSAIELEENYVCPKTNHSSLIQLAYNKNSMISRFSIKSVIALNIISHNSKVPMSVDEIVEKTLFLCDWLQFEFIFCKPCENLRDLIFEILSNEEWMHPVHGVLKAGCPSSVSELNFSGDFTEKTVLRVKNETCFEELLFFSNLIRPFVQSLYIVCSFVVSERCPSEPISDSLLVRNLCQESLDGTYSLPFLPNLESINSDSFKNSVRILKDKGLLKCKDSNTVSRSHNPKLYNLIDVLKKTLLIS